MARFRAKTPTGCSRALHGDAKSCEYLVIEDTDGREVASTAPQVDCLLQFRLRTGVTPELGEELECFSGREDISPQRPAPLKPIPQVQVVEYPEVVRVYDYGTVHYFGVERPQ